MKCVTRKNIFKNFILIFEAGGKPKVTKEERERQKAEETEKKLREAEEER